MLKRNKELKKIRIHDFRHSHVVLLIHNNEDYTVIKERLGHASITTTIDIYGHLFPSKQKSIADKLDSFFGSIINVGVENNLPQHKRKRH
ncbi:tyrosine-type recombinase/integrase [Listeria booriae]|nr:tyrosine-type recombinase/integrase [Listeria booriae]MBC2022598.1 tyrosine-type recombinase/integrase [Listeria booriae]MBC2034088.1 tyrosine-type recombinase/integrase [Listeria booriae]MBC2080949.1 tyrosine-type recombinase/integrase [Listeria booriae]